MGDHKPRILDRLEALAEEIGRETADAVVAEVRAFGPVRDAALKQEVFELSRGHVHAFISAARVDRQPTAEELELVRQRAAQRAREMVPLTAMLQAYLVGHRTLLQAITREAGTDAGSRGAVLELLYVLADRLPTICSVMVEAYVQTERGELADMETERRDLIEALLEPRVAVRPELVRRAAVLGLEPGESHVVALAMVAPRDGLEVEVPPSGFRRWASDAIARASDGPRRAFVVVRGAEIIAILRSSGAAARTVLERAAESLARTSSVVLLAGIGTPFANVTGFRASYDEARRALRHATPPFVVGPGEVLLFDELTASVDQSVRELVPAEARKALGQPSLRSALEAYIAANQNVAEAAQQLGIHPNTLRYRLSRIAELTGRDPRTLADLVELIAALRLLARESAAPS